MSSLRPGADVRGVTIAEFGSGNRPLDMIVYQKNGRDYLLMSNNRHGVMKVPTQDFGSADALTGIVPDGGTAGVPFEKVPAMAGVEQLDLLDDGARHRAGARDGRVTAEPADGGAPLIRGAGEAMSEGGTIVYH